MSYKILKVKLNEVTGLTINYTNLDGNKETILKIQKQDIIDEFYIVWRDLELETREVIDDALNPKIDSVILYGITLKPINNNYQNNPVGFVISCGFDIDKVRYNFNTPYYSLMLKAEGETLNFKTLRNLDALLAVTAEIIKGKRAQLDLINDTILNEEVQNEHLH